MFTQQRNQVHNLPMIGYRHIRRVWSR